MKTDPVAIATKLILIKLKGLLKKYPFKGEIDSEYLIRMCDVAIENHDLWPIDKLSRWLGFIQGTMITNGRTDVDSQRDFTRPLFHEAYKMKGMRVPSSVGIE